MSKIKWDPNVDCGEIIGKTPTEGKGIERDYVIRVENAFFQLDPTYAAAAKKGSGVQLVLRGVKVNEDGSLDHQVRNEKFGCGSEVSLAGEISGGEGGIKMATQVELAKYDRLAGGSQAGRLVNDLLWHFEKTEENKEDYPWTDSDGKKHYFSPTGARIFMWLKKRKVNAMGGRNAQMFNGMTLQLEAEEWRMKDDPPGEMRERTIAAGLIELEGEEGDQEEDAKPKATTTKAATTKANESKPANGAGASKNGSGNFDIEEFKATELKKIAEASEEPAKFRKAALSELDKIPDGKDKDALRLWCMKESNFWELMKA